MKFAHMLSSLHFRIVVSGIIIIMISFSIGRHVGRDDADALLLERDMRETQVRAIEARVEELRQQIATLNQEDAILRSAVGLDPVPEEVYQVGIGGREPHWPPRPPSTARAWDRLRRTRTPPARADCLPC